MHAFSCIFHEKRKNWKQLSTTIRNQCFVSSCNRWSFGEQETATVRQELVKRFLIQNRKYKSGLIYVTPSQPVFSFEQRCASILGRPQATLLGKKSIQMLEVTTEKETRGSLERSVEKVDEIANFLLLDTSGSIKLECELFRCTLPSVA